MSWDNQGKLFRKGIISRDYVDMVKFGHTKLRAADISVEKNTAMGILKVYSEVVRSSVGWSCGLGKGDEAQEVK